jgi:hypothetical protein
MAKGYKNGGKLDGLTVRPGEYVTVEINRPPWRCCLPAEDDIERSLPERTCGRRNQAAMRPRTSAACDQSGD